LLTLTTTAQKIAWLAKAPPRAQVPTQRGSRPKRGPLLRRSRLVAKRGLIQHQPSPISMQVTSRHALTKKLPWWMTL